MRKTAVRLIEKKLTEEIDKSPVGAQDKRNLYLVGRKRMKHYYHQIGKPLLPKPVFSKKRKKGESAGDFKCRMSEINRRRRARELDIKTKLNLSDPNFDRRRLQKRSTFISPHGGSLKISTVGR